MAQVFVSILFVPTVQEVVQEALRIISVNLNYYDSIIGSDMGTKAQHSVLGSINGEGLFKLLFMKSLFKI